MAERFFRCCDRAWVVVTRPLDDTERTCSCLAGSIRRSDGNLRPRAFQPGAAVLEEGLVAARGRVAGSFDRATSGALRLLPPRGARDALGDFDGLDALGGLGGLGGLGSLGGNIARVGFVAFGVFGALAGLGGLSGLAGLAGLMDLASSATLAVATVPPVSPLAAVKVLGAGLLDLALFE